ncbi:MAG: hypothetical protein AABX62_03280, partial [Thermoproteota archaeon]
MTRAPLCLLLVILSMFPIIPAGAPIAGQHHPRSALQPLFNPYALDPNGTTAAFNATYAQFDLYSNTTAILTPSLPAPGSNLTWYSRVNNTRTGQPVLGTAFIYRVDNNTANAQTISWNLTIPKPLQGATTFVKFRWNGTLGVGTDARYLLFNGTTLVPGVNVTKVGPTTFNGGSYLNSTGGIPVTCGVVDDCIVVSPGFVGFNLTLSFVFNSNSTGKG